jgi:hypothetical protein
MDLPLGTYRVTGGGEHVGPFGADEVATDVVHATFLVELTRVKGGALVNDGSTVTIVSRDCSPCPSDLQPMPYPATTAFVLPTGATHTPAWASTALEYPNAIGR